MVTHGGAKTTYLPEGCCRPGNCRASPHRERQFGPSKKRSKKTLKIFDIKVTPGETSTLTEAQVQSDGEIRPTKLWFRFEGLDAPPDRIADPFAVAMLPSCMLDNETCHVDGPLSPELQTGFAETQRILTDWYEFLSHVSVTGEAVPNSSATQSTTGIGCCFSAGVDSWYSLLKNQDRITHLLLVRGFDIGLDNNALWQSTRTSIEGVARRLDKQLIVCETNLRAVADRGRMSGSSRFDGDFWGRCLHGAALASCAIGLHRTIGELIVPATHSASLSRPWGSSPVLDPHWSNGRVTISHDGYEANRLEKIRHIVSSDLALETLRVCHNDENTINCGRCEKCLRTMIALHVCGALGRTLTLPNADAFSRLRRLPVQTHVLHHYESLLPEVRAFGDVELARMMEAIAGRRFSVERTIANIVRSVRRRQKALPQQ